MSIKSSQKSSSEISVAKLRRAYKTKDLLNLSVRARGIEYCDGFLSLDNILSGVRFSSDLDRFEPLYKLSTLLYFKAQ